MDGKWFLGGEGRCLLREVTKGERVMDPRNLIYRTCKHLALPARRFPFFFYGMRIIYSLFLHVNSKQAHAFEISRNTRQLICLDCCRLIGFHE